MTVTFSKPRTQKGIQRIEATLEGKSLVLTLDTKRTARGWSIQQEKKTRFEGLDLRVARKHAEAILTGDTAYFDTIERNRNGRPISERQKTSPYKPEAGWFVSTVGGKPAITDGYMILLGDLPKGHTQRGEHGKPLDLDRIIPGPHANLQPTSPIGFSLTANGRDDVYLDNGSCINGQFMDFVLKRYPKAQMYQEAQLTPVVFKQDGELVAVMMPLRINTIPAGIEALLAPTVTAS